MLHLPLLTVSSFAVSVTTKMFSSSSPDPLSFVASSPSKSAAIRRSTNRAAKPLAQVSPNVKRSDPFVEIPELGSGSPSKSIIMSTPKGGRSSPWRIKVTVEAQPQDDYSQDENSLTSPTGARAARIATQTTTIPLNDANGSSPLKRRGRPRKSDTLPPTQTTPGPLSPAKKRGRPRKTDTLAPVIAQTTTVPLNDAGESSPVKRKGRGRPRKSDATPVAAKARNGTPGRKPGKSITQSPNESDAESDLSDASYHPTKQAATRGRKNQHQDDNVPEPIRAAAMYGPRSPFERQNHVETEEMDSDSDAHSTQLDDNEQTPKPSSSRRAGNDEDMWKSMVSHHSYESEPTADEEENSTDDELDIVMPDQTIGDTTMLNSEEFSMVSLESLPGMQAALNITSPAVGSQAAVQPPHRTDPIPQTHRQRIVRQAISSPLPDINDSVASVSYMPSSPPIRFAARTPPRGQTAKSPSAPPAIQQAEVSPSKAETPKLVNVVKAGIALQGVVNGNNRGTQERRPSDDVREDTQRARLDNMFSEFESGTRRELQSGLRLGQQLSERTRLRPTTRENTREPTREPSLERPVTRGSSAASDGEVFDGPSASEMTNQDSSSHHRLPTPDEKDYALNSPPPPPSKLFVPEPNPAANNPPVNAAPVQLVSPVRSQASPDGEEMEDGANTPPSTAEEIEHQPENHQDSVLQRRPGEDSDVYWQRHREKTSKQVDEAGSSQVIVLGSDISEDSQLSTTESAQNPLDSDIWEEEGSRTYTRAAGRRGRRAASKRSADKSTENASSSSSQRGNSNRTSQRNASELSNGTNERTSGNPTGSSRSQSQRATQGRSAPSRTQRSSSEASSEGFQGAGTAGENTEETGLFWQNSSSPQREPSQHENNKLDLSMLMAINDSPAKESPPKERDLATPPKLQPSKTPYNLGNKLNSPVKGSPLKQQVLFSSPSAVNSSPYHRIEHSIGSSILHDEDAMAIDEESIISDTRQLRQERGRYSLGGRTRDIAPSPAVFAEEDLMVQRQIENELTPRSQRIKNLNLSGDRRRLFERSEPSVESEVAAQTERSSILEKNQSETSLRRSRTEKSHVENDLQSETSVHRGSSHMKTLNVHRERKPLFESRPLFEKTKPADTAPSQRPTPEPEVQQSGGIFGRLWTAVSGSSEPAAPVHTAPLHPLAARYNQLPRVAPWTKTHWDTLDRIYQRYKRHPEQFSPHDPLNKMLLAQEYQWEPSSPKTQPVSYYTNVQMQNWNYTVPITPELLVCCAIFMQLLTLCDAAEYRRATGKELNRGNFTQKDRAGDPITLRDVIARMFGVVGGEMIRADEKRGMCVRRDLDQLKLRYPWTPGWWDEMGRFLHN